VERLDEKVEKRVAEFADYRQKKASGNA